MNLAAVVVALVLGWALTMWQHRYNRTRQTRSVGGTIALYVLRLVVTVALITVIFKPDWFLRYAHGAAGVLLLTAFIATAFVSASLARRETRQPGRRNFATFYTVMARLMLGTLITIVSLHIWQPHLLGVLWVTVLESAVIIEFCVYWVIQTIDLWDSPDRADRLSVADQQLLAQKRTTVRPGGVKSELKDVMNAPKKDRLLLLL